MRSLAYFALALSTLPLALGSDCVAACQQALSKVTFTGTSLTVHRTQCRSQLGISSVFICSQLYCDSSDLKAGLSSWNNTCESGGISLPQYTTVADPAQVPTFELANIIPKHPYNVSMIPSEGLYKLAEASVDDRNYEDALNIRYRWAMYGFWGGVILIGIMNRIVLIWLSARQRIRIDTEMNGSVYGQRGIVQRTVTLFRRYLILPATFGYRCAQPAGWCTVPPRLQSITVAVFVLINIAIMSPNYPVFNGNLYWATTSEQVLRYLTNRAGTICLANLPFVWLFATRNNVLLWLTGWDYSTFSIFHRWVARVVTIEAIIHASTYTKYLFDVYGKSFYKSDWKEQYFYCGGIAVCSMAVINIFSMYGIRRRFYELFLHVHIALAVTALIGIYFHVGRENLDGYVWACVAVWAFDRTLRISRVLVLSTPFKRSKGMATYNATSNLIRLDMTPTTHKTPSPGSFYFIYVLDGLRFYESHPFTLAGWRKDGDESSICSTPPINSLAETGEKSEPIPTVTPVKQESSGKLSLSFVIRPQDGFTRRLRDLVKLEPAKLDVVVEGPYGPSAPLSCFQKVLFIVGGSGITVALSYLHTMLNSGQTFHIVWSVKSMEFFDDIMETEMLKFARRSSVTVHGYITSHETYDQDKFEAEEDLPRPWTLHRGRPHIRDTLFAEAEGYDGRIAVVTCGPAQMADDTRHAIVDGLAKGFDHVEYFEEKFGW